MCKHDRTTRGAIYEYCEGCGAVRHRFNGEDWHSCEKCTLCGGQHPKKGGSQ